MNKLALLASAGLLALAPLSTQAVEVRLGNSGNVRITDGDRRDYHRDRDHDRGYHRGHDRDFRGGDRLVSTSREYVTERDGDRYVITKRTYIQPDGDRVVKVDREKVYR